VRYVVINSVGMDMTQAEGRGANFPSFTRFYRSLREEAELIHVIDPAESGGKGPVIWIYDLGLATATTASLRTDSGVGEDSVSRGP
jgi:hypothetical protein